MKDGLTPNGYWSNSCQRERFSGWKGVVGLYSFMGFSGFLRLNWLMGLKGALIPHFV